MGRLPSTRNSTLHPALYPALAYYLTTSGLLPQPSVFISKQSNLISWPTILVATSICPAGDMDTTLVTQCPCTRATTVAARTTRHTVGAIT